MVTKKYHHPLPISLANVHNVTHSLSCHFPWSLIDDMVGIIDPIDSYLESNQLSGTIPSTIGSLSNLQYLYDNHVSLLPLCGGKQTHIDALHSLLPLPPLVPSTASWFTINSREAFHQRLDLSPIFNNCTHSNLTATTAKSHSFTV